VEDAISGTEDRVDVGAADELVRSPLRSAKAKAVDIALSVRDGTWGALSNACNHVGGPLGDGRLDQDYVVCPWHGWKFHRCTGVGEPGFEADQVPAFPVRIEGGHV
jgi:nitrite reductase/ring-hydroxylating ferredoxin subunit